MAEAILVIGELDSSWLSGIAQESTALLHHDLDQAGAMAQRARVLLIGDGIANASLATFMKTVREAAPTINLFCVSHDLSIRSDAAEADAAFQMPRDWALFRNAIAAAVRQGRGIPLLQYHDLIAGLVGFCLILAIWIAVTSLKLLPPFLMPTPVNVANAFFADSKAFLSDFAVTGLEALIGFLIGNAAGVLLAVLLYPSKRVQAAALPALTGLQALPIIALAPLLSLWFGTGFFSKIAMAAIVCFFPVITNLLAAFSNVDRDLVELFRFHRVTYTSTLRRLLFPASAPALIAGLRTSGSLAVVGALVAEFTGADRGLGYQILTASYRFETDRLFVAILLSGIMGMIFATLPALIGSTWLRWVRWRRLERSA